MPDPAGLQQLVEGLGAARAWLQRAHAFTAEGPHADLAALEAFVGEASGIPVALPEARALRERAAAARRLADALRAALPEGHEHSIDQVRWWLPSGLHTGKGAKAASRSLARPIHPTLRIAPSSTLPQLDLEHLQELQAEAARLRVRVPELAGLSAALDSVDVWRVRRQGLCSGWAACRRKGDGSAFLLAPRCPASTPRDHSARCPRSHRRVPARSRACAR